MGSRTMPYECPHGRTLDWGDFGPDPDDGSVGAERCGECDLADQLVRALHDARWCRCPDDRTMQCVESAAVIKEALIGDRPTAKEVVEEIHQLLRESWLTHRSHEPALPAIVETVGRYQRARLDG